MLPVVRGERETARQIVLYSLVLVGVTLLPWGWGGAGPVYVVCALALGAVFVGMAEKLRRDTTPRRAMLLFHYSLLYLALIFAALALDAVLLMDPELARKNARLGWLLFALFLLLFAGCIGVAFLYSPLPVDGRHLARAAGGVSRRHAGRRQGSPRHRRADDDVRVGALRRPRPRRERRGGAAARGGGLRRRREDEPPRVRVRDLVAEPALRDGAESGVSRTARGRLERRLGGGRRGG